jgi:hypothetical protein
MITIRGCRAAVWVAVAAVALAATATSATAVATVGPAGSGAAPIARPLAHPVWLCRPGMHANPCNQNLYGDPQVAVGGAPFEVTYPNDGKRTTLDATHVRASGTPIVEPYNAPDRPPVDCFYVYPTVDVVSNPVLPVGDLPPSATSTEMAATLSQVGRLTSLCRMFVPLYRQATLLQLAVNVAITHDPSAQQLGQNDIRQAWEQYWAHDNVDPVTHRRRGVVILGHSQGSTAAIDMIDADIDNDPVARGRLVSAVILGGQVQVPIGKLDGGGTDPASSFQHVPVCARSSSVAPLPTGCVVAFSSFDLPAGQSPGEGGFGRNGAPDHQIVCTNPRALLAGLPAAASVPLDTYLATQQLEAESALEGTLLAPIFGYAPPDRPTGYVRYTGVLGGRCRHSGTAEDNATWFQVDNSAALFPRQAISSLGLHTVDFNVTQGDLVELISAQTFLWVFAH